MLMDVVGACQNTVKGWRIAGIALLVCKILVPILILLTAIFPIFNWLVKGNADEAIKALKAIGKKLIAGLVVFLIPTIIEASINLLLGEDLKNEDSFICYSCFFNPQEEDCLDAINDYDTLEQKDIEKNKEKIKEKEGKSQEIGGTLKTDEMDEGEVDEPLEN